MRLPSFTRIRALRAEPECDWCERPAIGVVHAQWTLFDWDDHQVCEDHVHIAVRLFSKRYVDGQPPIGVWLRHWAREECPVRVVDSP